MTRDEFERMLLQASRDDRMSQATALELRDTARALLAAERERCAVAVDELATRARSQKRSAKTKLERESGAVAEFALSAAVTSIRALT